MRVLVACEESQTITKAFRALGHEAFSCDLVECSGGEPAWHILQDATIALEQDWDLVIAHPPCTYLTNSGARWLYDANGARDPARWDAMRKGAEFFKLFTSITKCPVAVENPIPLSVARDLMGSDYHQIIHPWQYGHGETKATCLWLRGLPLLQPTEIVEGREPACWRLPPSKDRARLRSKTYTGIAKAMASQWSDFLSN